MLERAPSAPNVTYRLGPAEHLPIEDQSRDLIAVGSALHWFHHGTDRRQGAAETLPIEDQRAGAMLRGRSMTIGFSSTQTGWRTTC